MNSKALYRILHKMSLAGVSAARSVEGFWAEDYTRYDAHIERCLCSPSLVWVCVTGELSVRVCSAWVALCVCACKIYVPTSWLVCLLSNVPSTEEALHTQRSPLIKGDTNLASNRSGTPARLGSTPYRWSQHSWPRGWCRAAWWFLCTQGVAAWLPLDARDIHTSWSDCNGWCCAAWWSLFTQATWLVCF